MIKILGLALYGPMAASTRYRLGQYVDKLENEDIKIELCFLLNDEYIKSKYKDEKISILNLVQSGIKRLIKLGLQKKYDLLIIHCELFPLLPAWFEKILINKPFIYDFDDAFFLKYRIGRFKIIDAILGNKFDEMMKKASAITAGSYTLYKYGKKFNENTYLLPTVVDHNRYINICKNKTGSFKVGWIGSPSTSQYLSEIIEPLEELGKEGSVEFIVIGGSAPAISNVKVIEIEWNEETEIEEINSFDVGIMPLPDNDWTRGKCAFKLVQYMACSVPVIGSRVGANIDVIDSDSGFLVSTKEEWIEKLRILRDNPIKRIELGNNARKRIINNYSLQKNLPLLISVIKKTISKV